MTEPAATAPSRGPTLRQAVLYSSITALMPLSIDMYLPAMPTMGQALHSWKGGVEMTFSAFMVGMAIGQLIYGPLSDRVGRRPPLLFGLSLFVCAAIGCAMSPNIDVLIGMRLLMAMGGGAGMVMVRATARDQFDTKQSVQLFSTMASIFVVAPMLAPGIGATILRIADWRALFFTLAGCGATALTICLFRFRETRSADTAIRAKTEHPLRSYLHVVSNPAVMGYVLTGALSGASMMTYISSSPSVVIGQFGLSPQMFGVAFGVNALGAVIGSQSNRLLIRRYSSQALLNVGNWTILGVGILLAVNAHFQLFGLWGFLVPTFLIMASLGLTGPNATASAMQIDPHRAGSVSAVFGAVQGAASGIAAAVTGMLNDGTARPMSLVIVFLLTTAALALRLVARPAAAALAARNPQGA